MSMRARSALLLVLVAIIIGFLGFTRLLHAEEIEGTYYQYETKNSIAFTDDPEQIPVRYAEKGITKTWADLYTKTDAKQSVAEPHPIPTWSDPGKPEVNPNHLNDCSAHITIEQVRLQVEEYNYEYFIARDECGKVVSVTRSEPTISLNR